MKPASECCQLVPVVGSLLDDICRQNSHIKIPPTSRFSAPAFQRVSVASFLQILWQSSRCSSEVLLYMVLLLNSATADGTVVLNYCTVHSIVLGAFVVACKLRDDFVLSNAALARVVGIEMSFLNSLELELLQLLQWNIAFSPEAVMELHHALNARLVEFGPAPLEPTPKYSAPQECPC